MEQNRNSGRNPGDDNKPKISFWFILITAVALILIGNSIYNFAKNSQYTQTTLSQFLEYRETQALDQVEFRYDRIVYLTKEEAAKPVSRQKAFYTGLPSGTDTYALAEELRAEGVTVNKQIVEDNSTVTMILTYVIMFGVLFGGMSLITRKMGSGGIMGAVGASRAKRYMEK